MKEIIIIFGGFFAIIALFISPTFRCVIFHPFKLLINGFKDTKNYFLHKKWNEAPFGQIVGYIADSGRVFGCGKTLTAVQYLTNLYEKYNDKMVWCSERKKFVKQKIVILNNVTLKKVPYINFVSLSQYVSLLDRKNANRLCKIDGTVRTSKRQTKRCYKGFS